MSEQVIDTQISKTTPTYGLVLAKNILQNFDVDLTDSELIHTLQNEDHIHFHILKVPYKHVFNSIILNQAQEYRIYIQKLFIDYLLSGVNDFSDDFPGADIRAQIETERLSFIALGEEFDKLVMNNDRLIADSQKQLIQLYKTLPSNSASFSDAQRQDLKVMMRPVVEQISEIKKSLCDYRNQFYASILRVRSMLSNISDYRVNQEKNAQNQQYLQFDPSIGED